MSQDFATEERAEFEMMICDTEEHNIVHSEEQVPKMFFMH